MDVAAAAVVQVPDINKSNFNHDYQSATSPLMTDFAFLELRNGELVVNYMNVVDTQSNIFLICV